MESPRVSFDINPMCKITRIAIDAHRDCLVVDDFFLRPQDVVNVANERASDFRLQLRGIPGALLQPSPLEVAPIRSFISNELSKEFKFSPDDAVLWTYFALVFRPPEELTWAQRIPHTDPGAENGRKSYAGVVYLFRDSNLGGTGFYRYKNEKFLDRADELGKQDPEEALEYLKRHLAMFRKPSEYITASCDAAELITKIPARFNRLLCYSGSIPHSPHIENPSLLRCDVLSGRLTLSFCVSAFED